MVTDQITEVALPSTSIVRPVLRKGQIENQDQIKEGQQLIVYGREDYKEKVTVVRDPFRKGGCRCITLSFRNGAYEITVNLADLSVIMYDNRTWNVDNWLGNY